MKIKMNAIEIMNEEHVYIKRMLRVIRTASYKLLKEDEVNYDDFTVIIDFIRNFADDHHHRKEEKILFLKMIENLGSTAEKVVKNGMLVEHDLSRLYIKDLEIALAKVKSNNNEAKLDVIANAVSYANLLERHIDKEDKVIYKYGERELSKEVLDEVNRECLEFEVENAHIRNKYIDILESLEKKYS